MNFMVLSLYVAAIYCCHYLWMLPVVAFKSCGGNKTECFVRQDSHTCLTGVSGSSLKWLTAFPRWGSCPDHYNFSCQRCPISSCSIHAEHCASFVMWLPWCGVLVGICSINLLPFAKGYGNCIHYYIIICVVYVTSDTPYNVERSSITQAQLLSCWISI